MTPQEFEERVEAALTAYRRRRRWAPAAREKMHAQTGYICYQYARQLQQEEPPLKELREITRGFTQIAENHQESLERIPVDTRPGVRQILRNVLSTSFHASVSSLVQHYVPQHC